jgi:cyclopropane-fatty-acyl-phospholipid synthase
VSGELTQGGRELGFGRGEARRRYGAEIATILHLARGLKRGQLTIVLPDGESTRLAGEEPGPAATLRLHSGKVARRYSLGGAVGFADSFIDGDWDSPDLASLLELLDRNADAWGTSYYGAALGRWARRLRHALRANTRRGSRHNIHDHYDLGNRFFASWLDRTMLYSSARFAEPRADLEAAQLEKCRRLARRMELRPGHRLLEIGSGWGSFALMAARDFGARVTSITISREQLDFARRRVQEEGLGEQVEVRFQDYRDVEGVFDRIASIEMFEAVGERFWPVYFRKLRENLVSGGLAGLQIITIADPFYGAYRKTPDFIQKYIFPGGMLPCPAVLRQHYAQAGLELLRTEYFGQDYARTLGIWRRRFEGAWGQIRGMGFDERFRRIWTYYLAYCEAGFRTGSIDVGQTLLRAT